MTPNEIRKSVAIGTVIGTLSCRLYKDGFYEKDEAGIGYELKAVLIHEIWEECGFLKKYGVLTDADLYAATALTYPYAVTGTVSETDETLFKPSRVEDELIYFDSVR